MTATLIIHENLWSGRSRVQPPPTERELRLPTDGTFALSFHGEEHTLTVSRIGAGAVELSPIGMPPAIVNEDGSIGPHQMADQTRLAPGQTLKLSTWTLDAGATWELSVQEISL